MSAVAQVSPGEALLRRLEWTVLKRLDGWLHGDLRSLWRGVGLDFADLREYQILDDIRHIDWNVTARTSVPHVRLFNEDRDLTVWFVVDCSESQHFGTGGKPKSQVAAEFVGLMARLLTRQGHRVGAIVFRTQVDCVVPPRGGRVQVLQLLRALKVGASEKHPAKRDGHERPTNLGSVLQAASNHIKRRSIVFVVSDFISEPGWEAPLGRLCLRNEVSAVRLFDPAEVSLPNLGLVWLQDAESGERLQVDTRDPALRKRFADLAQEREVQLRVVLARAGVDTLELTTQEPLLEAMLRFADLRKRRARAHLHGVVAPLSTKVNSTP